MLIANERDREGGKACVMETTRGKPERRATGRNERENERER